MSSNLSTSVSSSSSGLSLSVCASAVMLVDSHSRSIVPVKRASSLLQYRLLVIICTFGITVPSTLYNIMGQNLGINAAWRNKYSVFLATVCVAAPMTCLRSCDAVPSRRCKAFV